MKSVKISTFKNLGHTVLGVGVKKYLLHAIEFLQTLAKWYGVKRLELLFRMLLLLTLYRP